MGLADWFNKEKRAERAFERTCKRVINRNAQHEERMTAIESLAVYANNGKDGALLGVLRRFDQTADKPNEDTAEKRFAREVLEEFGTQSIDPIRKYMSFSENVTWPVQILRKVSDDETTVSAVLEVLENLLAADSFKPTKKLRLLEALADFDDARIPGAILPGLLDFDEPVRFQTIEILFACGDEQAREPLLKLLVDEDEESDRIRQRIMRGLTDLDWPVTGYRKAVEEMLVDGQYVDRSGKIRQSKQSAEG